MRSRFFSLLFFLILLGGPAFSSVLFAQSAVNVSVDDPVYRKIDKLVSLGLIKDAVYGQRPWSRNEIARMAVEAKKNWEALQPPLAPDDQELAPRVEAKDIIDALFENYREELETRGDIDGASGKTWHVHPLDKASLEYTLLHSPPRDIPVSNGVGTIDGFINPLVQNREGLDFANGNNLALETSHSADLTKYFSVFFRQNTRLLVPNSGENKLRFRVQDLYGKFNIHNFELEVGRDHLIWGQADTGGLLLSNNARSLDMIKISNDSPFYHPWIFKYLGPSKYTFFVSNLGPDRAFFPNAFLYGLKVSIKPAHFLELGLSETVITGGDGAPKLSFFDPLIELFPINKVGHNTDFTDKSDHRFGIFDMRFTIPPLRNTAVYFESFFEDSPLRAISHFGNIWQQMGMMIGVYAPLLTSDGTVSLRTEFRHEPGWSYRHSTWATGYTLNRQIIGDPLGPAGDSISVSSDIDVSQTKLLNMSFAYERRGSDLYGQTTDPSTGGNETVIVLQHNPIEHRFRVASSLRCQINPSIEMVPQLAYERVVNYNFIPGNGRNDFLGGLTLTLRPAWGF